MSQDGRRPTGLGLSYNHIEDLATCQRNYSSVMDRAGVLRATPNVEVARLAQSVGYTNATASNSFAFNSCSQKNCSKILPHSGCDSSLSCISRAVPNNEVFTVCTDSDSNFRVYKKRWGIYRDINLLTLTVKGTSRYSRHENWCRDYQKLCKSFGLRPAGRGTHYLGKVGICRDKYHSLVFSINIDGNAIKNAGKTTTSHYFTFYDCNRCSSYSYSTRYALDQFYYSHYYHSTACTGPQGVAFRVLDEKAVSLNGSKYLAIKAQVPVDGKSKGSDWCEDYQSLCESYGLKPVGCGGQCITKYSAALKPGGPGCQASRTKVKQIANDAGFSQATETNSFALNDCNGCSSRISDRECLEEDLFCLNAHNPYRVVYTVCVNDRNAIKVIETRSTFYESTPYLVVKTELPSNGEYGLQNWCEEYQQLCESFDKKPTGCGAAYSSDPLYSSCHNNYSSVMPINDHLGCGKYSVAGEIATKVGFSDAYWFNTFIFHQCSPNNCTTRLTYGCSEDCKCHPSLNCINSTISSSNRRAYAICVGADSAFEVLDTRETDFNGDDLLVVKARLPSDGVAAYQNWCDDYRRLCLSYRRRPTGCGSDYSHEIGYSRCRTRYQSVMPEHNVYGCPPDRTVSTIALSVGFTSANSDNSFAFSDCTNSCVKTLTIGNQFINISVPNREVYTICSTSNSNFKVASNRETYYRGGYFLFVEAEVPSHYRSKHADWCTDYQRMCESYGLRPVGLNAREVSDRYASCIKRHGAVNTERVEATEKGQVKLLGGKLGYTQIDDCNSFTLNEYCDNHCHDDLLSFEPDRYKSLYCISRNHIENSNFLVYTVCASSDSNFHVISSKSLVYHGQNYLVVMATLPSHRESKYESWCKDYERLCRTFKMRPVGCSTSYQWSSNYRSCVEKFRSVMVENSPLGCNSSETVASVANMAGFHSAYPNNSFTFHQCSGEGSCPKKLTKSCPESLSCLNGQSDVVYTVCTDSASAFIVEYVGNSRERDLPLLVIGATLPAVQEPKSEDWCLDYQKLCESFAARPMSCDATKGNIYRSCSSDYNALVPSDEIQRCFNDGASDIKRLVDLIPGLDGGRYFKFHICSKANCESPIADTLCHNSLYCLKQNSNYVYTVCSRSSSNFEVVETSSTSYGEFDDILAIKARVPIHGQSLYDTWCHDYEKACSLFGKKPLACPLHTDYVEESRYHSCREDFNGYMMKNSSLTCPMSDFVANVSKLAGFSSASPANSIALSTCSSCSNTLNFVSDSTSNMTYLSLSALSTCPPHAVCSSWSPNVIPPEIYMLCVKPPKVSTFEVKETRKVSYQGRKFTVFRLTAPHDELSIFGDWCTDYQKLCESVSMRPITCGSGYTHIKRHRDCRSRYNAIMLRGFSCSPHSSIRRVVAQAGFSVDTSRTFGMLNCMYCGANLRGTDALHYIRYAGGFLYTACANTDGAFNVLQTRNVVVSSISFMVLKAHLPKNLLSSHESWCKDYQMMCESYGKRPLSCPEIGMCKVTYNSLSVGSVKCGDASNLQYIPRSAGFLEATKDNTFVLQSCEINQCSRRIPDEGCDGALGCINSMISNREVYTMCISSTTAYDVIATKEVEYSSRKYLVVRVKLPSHGISKYYSWCHDYSELCREYSLRPLTCLNSRCIDFHHAIWLTTEACPVTSGISFIASRADMTQVTDNTNFVFSTHCFGSQCKKVAYDTNCTENGKHPLNCYDRTLNDGEFTTLCVGPNTETAFPIIDFRTVSYSERNYLVVRTQKRRRESQKGNWCHDYRYLCESFRMRPLACPEQYSINSYHHYCKRNYLAVMMDNVDHGCPINEFVAELAQLAGFTGANSGNSFAFHNCSGHHCTKVLREEDCNEGLYCLNTISSQRDLYTACAASYDSGFTVVDYKTVSHNSKTYDVIQVTVSENQRSLHENWCRDYQRLCASFQRIPLECYNPGETVSSDICTDSFGASRQIECGNTARSIASKSGFSSVQGKTIVMHRCTDCPKVMTKTCTHSLDCARAGAGSLYVICAEQKTVSGGTLKPLQTRSLIYGLESYLLIQTHLLNYYSKLRDWRQEYIKLCSLFGYLPIACGEYSSDNNNDVNYCRSKYNVLSSKGDDFGCPPSETIAIIARQVGFYEANKRNTFAMYKCGASYSTTLSSSSCHGHLSCLLRSPPKGIVYTMCAKPIPSNSLGFQVLDKKKITFLRTNYLALKVKIDVDGNALLDNWCYDYRELCRQFNMVPTGCGSQNEDDIPFSKCKTKYNSFMPYSNVLRCESVTRPAAIVRKAGFPNADKKNTFVFNRCDKCVKRLSSTGGCDSALHCLHVDVWKKEAYTLCVDRLSGFEVLGTRETSYDNKEFLVIEAALPEDARAIHDNWCQDYQKMCYSFGKFPVACSIDANTADVRKYAKRYGAATVESIPCSPVATVVSIARSAGYLQAKSGNSFVFAAHSDSDCPKDMGSSGCTAALDCVNSKSRVVYTLCTNPTNFEISDVKYANHEQNTFTVIEARIPVTGLSKAATWCDDYASLCRAIKQQPVACQSLGGLEEYGKCSEDYGAYTLTDKYRCLQSDMSLHEIAQIAGFPDASFGNTFGFKACSSQTCQKQLYVGPECDPSLNCINDKVPNRQVFALCIKDGNLSNFEVQETKQIETSNILYLAIRALVPSHGKSKHETWCKDYERVCQAQSMRPVRCFSEQNRDCLGQFHALVVSTPQFDCRNNSKLVKFLKNAGFNKSSSNNTFIYGTCASSKLCRERLRSSQCDDSLNCLKRPSVNREVFMVCARSLATSFIYHEARSTFYAGAHYLVIKASLAANGISTNQNWCYDYREMCASFGKRPVVRGSLSSVTDSYKAPCFSIYNGTATHHAVENPRGLAESAGFNPGNCAASFVNCCNCFETFQHCPFGSCNCVDFYLICL